MTELKGIARLEELARTPFPNLGRARATSERRLAARRQQFAQLPADPDAAVVLTGSWGRREVTSASDDDFIVLFAGDRRDEASPSGGDVAMLLNGRLPGPEGTFGDQVWLADLLGNIGLAKDSNENLTQRMLLLLESVAVQGMPVHAARSSNPACSHSSSTIRT